MSANKPKFEAKDLAVLRVMKREFVLYPVEQNELHTLASGFNSIHFGLAGISFSALVTLGTTRLLANSLSDHEKVILFCALLICLIATVYFSAMAIRDYRNSMGILKGIKTETTTVIIRPEK
jgi:hypothetical protein